MKTKQEEDCKDQQINILLDELKEIGFSKQKLMDLIKGKGQDEALKFLRNYRGKVEC